MKKATVAGITTSLALMCSPAYAERSLVILLDGTGSMTAIRDDGTCGMACPTRFEAAVDAAVDDLLLLNSSTEGIEQAAVFMFYSPETAVPLTGTPGNPFVTTITGELDPTSVEYALRNAAVTPWATPLAGAMCDAVTAARDSTPSSIFTPPTRWLKVYTDGEENATDPASMCAGPPSTVLHEAPFDDGSWHQKVYQHTTNPLPSVVVDATLYTNLGNPFAFSTFSTPPATEIGATPGPSGFSILAAPVTDLEFFTILTRDNGGQMTVVDDSAPAPVIGDLDFDFDVDRDDAIALARAFGTPATREHDLDENGSIGFSDYTRLLARFGDGTGTPAPDPYTQGTVVNCVGFGTVTIENKVIEAGGLTIRGTGACSVVIRNSLIVSGSTAITTTGVASLRVDDSYIVGEGAWLQSAGVFTLSAANTVFHGPRQSLGVFAYQNRGGNTFE